MAWPQGSRLQSPSLCRHTCVQPTLYHLTAKKGIGRMAGGREHQASLRLCMHLAYMHHPGSMQCLNEACQ